MCVREKELCVFLLVITVAITLLVGCPMYTEIGFKYEEAGAIDDGSRSEGTDPAVVKTSEPELTLAWDDSNPGTDFYRVLFRIHDAIPEAPWLILKDDLSAAPNPEYTIPPEDKETGIFDFGVIAVDLEADESPLHSSLDTSAQPGTGWYLLWTN